MRNRAIWHLPIVTVVLLITWQLSINSFDVTEKARNILGLSYRELIKTRLKAVTTAPQPKCSLPGVCPPDHFAFHITSGAAYVVGPKICFEGKNIMSHVLNNVGGGLNVVVVNGESGAVENFQHLNMINGVPGDILAFLKAIKPGMIVLAASYDDVTNIMTDEMREVFVGMGSTLIKSVKRRDNWVFAGRAGTHNESLFEKQAVSDESTNIYEGWPELAEVGGCFPRTPADEHKP